MCGIVGFINLDGAPASAGVLQRMLDVQRHRGPDDSGIRAFSLASQKSREVANSQAGIATASGFEGVLGFNRLSIRDLSIRGHQPMCNRDESVFLAFNGEIYNTPGLRDELKSGGFEFSSTTDTEVVLYLYERFGLEGMLDRVNGMFSICIVDLNRQKVYLARDHFGIKPLYWTKIGNTVLFSSETKSFLKHPLFKAELDQSNVDEYTAFRYCAGENTLLTGVKQLMPGHWLRIDASEIEIRRYWEIPSIEDSYPLGDRDALDELDRLLGASVQSQLVSDVSLGSQLSGGVDSSLVTLYAKARSDTDLEAFSIVFQDVRYSEREWIDQASSSLDVTSHLFEMRVADMLSSFEQATWHLDQPLNLPNSLGIYLLAQKSKPLVTVLLSGEGADELFGGYSRYYDAALRDRLGSFLPLIERIPGLGKRLQQKFRTSMSPSDAFILSSAALELGELIDLRPEFNIDEALRNRRELLSGSEAPTVSSFQKFDMQTYMVDLLVRQDKMTMAHSLENRVPFLDRDLVSFVRSLKTNQLVGNSIVFDRGYSRNTKKILKELAARKFSHGFAYRKKSGFPLPLEEFFQAPQFESYMEDLILPGIKNRGIFRFDTVNRWWREIGATGSKNGRRLWIAVAFEIWAREFMDKQHVVAQH